ncbi:MAG TPA: hypothetical protein VFA67_04900 [Candidatus Sulfotelmatobacter sp.]|nr:hypothetical protein [Candidatus Sulfotelmatobacter sp.]
MGQALETDLACPALVAFRVFYVGFLVYAFSARGGFLFIDS